jgi:hypothetical protein
MNQWRAYRPAIWTAMAGIAVIIIVSPHYLGAFLLGGAIGIVIRIRQRERLRARRQATAEKRSGGSGGRRSGPGKRRSR